MEPRVFVRHLAHFFARRKVRRGGEFQRKFPLGLGIPLSVRRVKVAEFLGHQGERSRFGVARNEVGERFVAMEVFGQVPNRNFNALIDGSLRFVEAKRVKARARGMKVCRQRAAVRFELLDRFGKFRERRRAERALQCHGRALEVLLVLND